MKLNIDFSIYEYREPTNNFSFSLLAIKLWVRNLIQSSAINPPLRYKAFFRVRGRHVSYKILGSEISFDDTEINVSTLQHVKRLKLYNAISGFIYFAIVFFGALGVSMIGPYFNSFSTRVIYNVSIFFLGTINAILAARVAVFLVDRHFADTLAAISGIYLLIALKNEKPISDPYRKRTLLGHLRSLRKKLVLLSTTFVDHQLENDDQLSAHFKRMEDFVSERERRLIISSTTTLEDFRREFPDFIKILITGHYGTFSAEQSDSNLVQAVPSRRESSFMIKMLRFLAAIFPFTILGVLFFLPETIVRLGLDTNIILLISIAWILLVIDASLKLGIVDRATSLLKTMKDLR